MNDLLKNKFKDKDPKESINTMRNKLNEIGIMPIEHIWFNSVGQYYSVHLKIPNTKIFTNGKGISYDFALASAYGEFLERLQNQLIYRDKVPFSKEVESFKGFKFAPDEVYLSVDEVKSGVKDGVNIYLPPTQKNGITKEMIEQWKLIKMYNYNDEIISVPFFDKETKKVVYVPLPVVDICYGSNGMCAGNTPEEALIEGTCELLERYAKEKIFNGEVIAPDIPNDYIKKFDIPYNMILELCSNSKYNIIVKDCSLGIGLPVVAAVIIDLEEQKYFWSFGAHPVFEIALTRTLTEMLQGRDINTTNDMVEFSFKEENFGINERAMIFKNGVGKYPIKSFSNEFSYEFKPFLNIEEKNNTELLKHLLKLLDDNNINIMIRDVSFLGIPSYQVIMPGVSELFELNSNLNQYIEKRDMEVLLRDVNKLDDSQLKYVVDYLEKYNNIYQENMMTFTRTPLRENFNWNNIKIGLFLGMACYKLGMYDKSFYYLDKFVQVLKLNNEKDMLKYYKCLRDYVGMKNKQNYNDNDLNILKIFYGEELLQIVIDEMSVNKDIFKNYGSLNCWDCKNCPYKNICSYKMLESIHLNLKEKYAQNEINQENSVLLKFL